MIASPRKWNTVHVGSVFGPLQGKCEQVIYNRIGVLYEVFFGPVPVRNLNDVV